MKSKEKKGDNRVSFKSMIIAMIVALLAFLGFGGFDLGNGDGADVDTGDKSGVESMVDDTKDNSESDVADNVEKDTELSSYTIYVRDDKYFVVEESSKELKEVTLDKIEESLALLSEETVIIIFDDAAMEKPYSDLMKLVDESGLKFSEDTVTK